MVNDQLSDFTARLRNAYSAARETVTMPTSRAVENVAKILAKEGYVEGYKIEKGIINVNLKYKDGKPALTGIRRVSKPGARIYTRIGNLKKVWGGWGLSILSTSAGVMSEKEARSKKTGGEIICQVW